MRSESRPHPSAGSLEAEFRDVLSRSALLSQRTNRRLVRDNWTKRLGIAVLNFFTGQQTLSIRQSVINGSRCWVIYDPQRDVRRVFETEQAVRAWLESGDSL